MDNGSDRRHASLLAYVCTYMYRPKASFDKFAVKMAWHGMAWDGGPKEDESYFNMLYLCLPLGEITSFIRIWQKNPIRNHFYTNTIIIRPHPHH